jgi:hypothetical protein
MKKCFRLITIGNLSLFLFILDKHWRELNQRARTSFQSAWALSTKSNIKTQIKAYCLFCVYFKLQPFPLQPKALQPYIQFLCDSFSSIQSVRNYLCGLQTCHKIMSLPFPDLSEFHVKMHLRGAARLKQHAPNRAQPLTPAMLQKMSEKMDFKSTSHNTVWAAILSGFFTFSRISNLVPKSSSLKSQHFLRKQDIILAEDGIVFITNSSKTIQFNQRTLVTPVVAIPDSILCPKQAIVRMFQLCPTKNHQPAFCFLSNQQVVPLTQINLIEVMRKLLISLGHDPIKYSGHSLRRGGATCGFSSGVPSELLKNHGDWHSDAYLSYLDFSMEDKIKVSEMMTSQL